MNKAMTITQLIAVRNIANPIRDELNPQLLLSKVLFVQIAIAIATVKNAIITNAVSITQAGLTMSESSL